MLQVRDIAGVRNYQEGLPIERCRELLEQLFYLAGIGRPDEKIQRHRFIVVRACRATGFISSPRPNCA